uniref:Ribonuclease Z n=1 Tax=Yamadaella caenomyce TaxID=259029 RepID=A0A1G4NYD8_9FLOR|nr:Ribonuclease Z [Yamadaella caenomyce]SCW23711.1 Ribonuclease Z [Yamadaella caenomyce]
MIYDHFNFFIKCSQTGEILLFNCPEGCQHILIKHKVKLHQINHIIFSDLSINNLGGLAGLLASLSLYKRINSINLYGPKGLLNYINLIRKYSQTTFKYNIYVHTRTILSIQNKVLCWSINYPKDKACTSMMYSLFESEKQGRFQILKAKKYQIPTGPIYALLKLHRSFLLPDGTIIQGSFFTYPHIHGVKITTLTNPYIYRANPILTSKKTCTVSYRYKARN